MEEKIAHAIEACKGLSVHGLSLSDLLRIAESTVRDVDVAELWSGVGNIQRAASSSGFQAVSFDLRNSPAQDMRTAGGFLAAVSLISKVKVGGLAWLAPPCSSFCYLCSVSTKRNRQNLYGDESVAKVREGNYMATAAMLFFCLAYVRGVQVVVENTRGNFFWRFPPVERVLRLLDTFSTNCSRCRFSSRKMKKYGKAYHFASTAPWVQELEAKCQCTEPHAPLVVHSTSKAGKKQVTGLGAALIESGAYPLPLARKVVRVWVHGNGGTLAPGAKHTQRASNTPVDMERASKAARAVGSWKWPSLSDDFRTGNSAGRQAESMSWKGPCVSDLPGYQPESTVRTEASADCGLQSPWQAPGLYDDM